MARPRTRRRPTLVPLEPRPAAAPSRTTSPAPLDPALRSLRANHPEADASLVLKAYEVAERAHEGQIRRSGDPYITHPLAVAGILADLGMDVPTLSAALLHDTVE